MTEAAEREGGLRKTAPLVLVVDDCAAICCLVADILTRVGYRVLTATSGSEALQVASGEKEIDVLVSDLAMPGMRGDQLISAFRGIYPRAGIVCMSAGSGEIEVPGPCEFLAKPFSIDRLLLLVEKATGVRTKLADAAPLAGEHEATAAA